MISNISPRPASANFSRDDWKKAFLALEQVFQSFEWPDGDARFRQNRLIELLEGRQVGRVLASAVIENLLSRKVFTAGKSFYNLRIFVRFSGEQTDEATPDRYLHTTRQRW